MLTTIDPQVSAFLDGKPKRLFIGGHWVEREKPEHRVRRCRPRHGGGRIRVEAGIFYNMGQDCTAGSRVFVQDPASPFGGFKESGIGREMGFQGIELYTEVKSVWVNLA